MEDELPVLKQIKRENARFRAEEQKGYEFQLLSKRGEWKETGVKCRTGQDATLTEGRTVTPTTPWPVKRGVEYKIVCTELGVSIAFTPGKIGNLAITFHYKDFMTAPAVQSWEIK